MSTAASYMPISQTAAGMSHYSQYPQSSHSYPAPSYGYSYGNTTTGYSTGQSMPVTSGGLPPQLHPIGSTAASGHMYHAHGAYAPSGHHQAHTFDTSGQVAPTGFRPKITATLWEDEGTLCFQVEARGICVARREDNGYINGTKLLNVCGMTRGRRDGILKSEKARNVVKIGPMHLKGVWIPYEKALEFANREKITDILYPLFVHDISRVMTVQGNSNTDRPHGLDVARLRARVGGVGKDTLNQMPSPIGPSSLSTIAQVAGGSRPPMERSHTIPTPPTSASSVIGGQNNSYDWNNQNMSGNVQHAAPLAIDTTLSNSRSLPNTPASTPPGNTAQSMQPYQHSSISQYPMTQTIPRYSQPNHYIKSEMGPPMKTPATGESDPDIKHDPYNQNNTDTSDVSHDDGYPRGNYMSYNNIVENAITSPDHVNGSSPHQTTGRITPRTPLGTSTWDYSTTPRSNATYDAPSNGATSYAGTGYTPNPLAGLKRGREDDDLDYKRPSIGNDLDAMKRRRGTESNITSLSSFDHNRHTQPGNAIIPRTR